MTYTNPVFNQREGCNDRIINDLRTGVALSGGQAVGMSGDTLALATINDIPLGWVGNYYNSGEVVDIIRDGRIVVQVAEAISAGIPVCAGVNGTVESFTVTRHKTGGATACGIMVENVASGLFGAMEII